MVEVKEEPIDIPTEEDVLVFPLEVTELQRGVSEENILKIKSEPDPEENENWNSEETPHPIAIGQDQVQFVKKDPFEVQNEFFVKVEPGLLEVYENEAIGNEDSSQDRATASSARNLDALFDDELEFLMSLDDDADTKVVASDYFLTSNKQKELTAEDIFESPDAFSAIDDIDLECLSSSDEEFDESFFDPILKCRITNVCGQRRETFTCKCKLNNGISCCSNFSMDDIVSYRMSIIEMTKTEQDLIISGQLSSQVHVDDATVSTKKFGKERRKTRLDFYFHSKKICRDLFMFLHCIGSKDRLYSLVNRVILSKGVSLRNSGGNKNHNATRYTYEDVNYALTFLQNYAENNAVAIPGWIPGMRNWEVKVLPSSDNHANVHKKYTESCDAAKLKSMSSRTFFRIWNSLCPDITFMKPMTDLCKICQQNSLVLSKCSGETEVKKLKLLDEYRNHLQIVNMERKAYQSRVQSSKSVFSNAAEPPAQGASPCSSDISFNISMDMAQQVHYPSHPLQAGPLYFLTPIRCGVFGICNEGLPMQMNYLFDERVACGKGANAVISYLHDYLSSQCFGEKIIHITADNCSGQNKNNAVLQYLSWRVSCGLHEKIHYHFLITGHTKFAPDLYFGLFKRTFRVSAINDIRDVAASIEQSTKNMHNRAKLCGSEVGDVLVKVYNWKDHLKSHYVTLPQIKKYHHFSFLKDKPGITIAKEYVTSDAVEFKIQIKNVSDKLPEIIYPEPMSAERQWYLYEKIRLYCPNDNKDIVAPLPKVPKQAVVVNEEEGNPDPHNPTAEEVREVAESRQSKKKRKTK